MHASTQNRSNSTGSKGAMGWIAAAAILGCTALTGCQVDIAGQTLPSPTYLSDDVEYFAPGPEFKLAREAAAMKAQAEAYDNNGSGDNCCP